MGGKDWKAEAQRLLAEALGNNDNGLLPLPRPEPGMHFYGPVTMVNVINDGPVPGAQRQVLQARLTGQVQAEGLPVAAAFQEELGRVYGTSSIDRLTDTQLGDLLGRFERMIRIARLLAVTPKR